MSAKASDQAPRAGGPSTHSAPPMIADHLALDFVNTKATPDGLPVDWLGDGSGLNRWLVATGAAADSVGDADVVLGHARVLRDWLRSLLETMRFDVASWPAGQCDPLNTVLAAMPAYRQIEFVGQRATWSAPVVTSPLAPLFPVAAAIGDLLCDTDLSRVRRCAGHRCTLWFLDRTKGGKRKWCSMAVCGNRAKAKAHRNRTSP